MMFTADEAEKAALGCFLAQPAVWPMFLDEGIRVEHFALTANAEVYRSLVSLSLEGHPVNFKTVGMDLEKRGKLATVTAAYLSELHMDAIPPTALRSALENLKTKLMHRRLHSALDGHLAKAKGAGCDVRLVIADAMADLESISNESQKSNHRSIKEIVNSTVERIIRRGEGQQDAIGTKCDLPKFDRETGGARRGAYWAVAGPAKGGKTAFALHMLEALVLGAKQRCVFFGLEMPAEENVERLLCKIGRVRGQDIRDGNIDSIKSGNIAAAGSRLRESPLIFRDSCFELSQIVAEIKQIKVVHPDLFGVFVDYTQLVSGPGNSRQEEVANVSRTLRKISMQENLFLVALSQLNDEGKIRESRTLMMDATCIVKIELDQDPRLRVVKLIQRNGRSGVKIRMNYDGDYCLFTETEDREEVTSMADAEPKPFKPHPNARRRQ